MVMKRIKIRLDRSNDDNDGSSSSSSAVAKVLRFNDTIEFSTLIEKIMQKLGLTENDHDPDQHVEEQFELWLGGESLLEETDEIDSGDQVVLVKKKKKEKAQADEDDEDGDDNVEDVTEECLNEKQSKRKVVELLSSDEEDEDDDDEEIDDDDDDDDGSVEEGSDAWDDEPSSSSSEDASDDSDFDEEEEERKISASRKRKAKPPTESPLQVFMDEKDVPSAPGKRGGDEQQEDADPCTNNDLEEVSLLISGAGRKKADRAVKDRIIKLLNTGFHDESNENEAKNAMKLAQRLMRKHNLSQALLLKERQEKNHKDQNGSGASDEILKGGTVTVHIVTRKTGKPALYARWLSQLTDPITENFDVKCYHSCARGRQCSVTFYGIYTNAQLAAYAYRVATERIAQMAAVYTPAKQPSYFWWKDVSTKSARLSYAIGVVKGISKDVENNIKLEKERRLRKLERMRQAVSTGEAYEDSDDDDFGDKEGTAGFSFPSPSSEKNESLKPAASLKASTVKSEDKEDHDDSDRDEDDDNDEQQKTRKKNQVDVDRRLEELEKEQQAAIVLVDHREKIAEQVLEEQGIKLRKGRKRKAISFDHRSYHKGIEDAKEIDINQRAIRDEVKVKKEGKKTKC